MGEKAVADFLLLNVRGCNPSNYTHRLKIRQLGEFVTSSPAEIPFLTFTETHINSLIGDQEVAIPGYNVFRADRVRRHQGGVAVYVKSSILVGDQSIFSSSYCEAAILYLESIDFIVIGVYRPPPNFSEPEKSCPVDHFRNLCSAIRVFAAKHTSATIILSGDFNFPFMDWNKYDVTTGMNVLQSERQSAELLVQLAEDLFLDQVVTEPTRRGKSNNILDLVLVNNAALVHSLEVTGTSLSDHDLVTVRMCKSEIPGLDPSKRGPTRPARWDFKFRRSLITAIDATLLSTLADSSSTSQPQGYAIPPKWFLVVCTHQKSGTVRSVFDSVNLHKANWDASREELYAVDWVTRCGSDDQNIVWDNFIDIVGEICCRHAPPKGPSRARHPSRRIPHDRVILLRKKRKLKIRLTAVKAINPGDVPRISYLINLLGDIELDMAASIEREDRQSEQRAIEKIKINPKSFYSFANRMKPSSCRIGPLRKPDGGLTSDPVDMANLLQDQYTAVFSDPVPATPLSDRGSPLKALNDISISAQAIIEAIGEMDISSAPGPDKFPVVVLKECSQLLAPVLADLWQRGFNSGQVAEIFKHQTIVPIYKKGDRGQPSNYRPVSLTSHLAKLFERVVRKEMVTFIEGNGLLSQSQHGFRHGRSCMTQLVEHLDAVLGDLELGYNADVMLLDMAKAFDKVSHQKLLEKLNKFGIGGKLLNWIESFLVGRSQSVVVQGVMSTSAEVKSGVPQGTVLAPLLFLLYVDDLASVLKHSSIRLFADDAKVHKTIQTEGDRKLLLEDLGRIDQWAKENSMQLHSNKYQLLQHGGNEELKCPYNLSNGHIVSSTETVRDLGVTVDTGLNWKDHITEICGKAKQVSGRILRSFESRDKDTMLTLLKSFVRPQLEYVSPIWSPHSVGDIGRLEALQRSFTAKINGLESLNYWERLRVLDLYSLQRRRERYKILLVWKIYRGLIPNHMNLSFRESGRRGAFVQRPLGKSSSKRINSLIFNSCTSTAVSLFNAAPREVKDKGTLEGAKRALDKFLRQIPDEPPIKGYGCQNHNSILEWLASRGTLITVDT